jgi:hypothetical protein
MISASIVLNFNPKLSIFQYDTWAAGSAALDRFRLYLPDLQLMAIGQAAAAGVITIIIIVDADDDHGGRHHRHGGDHHRHRRQTRPTPGLISNALYCGWSRGWRAQRCRSVGHWPSTSSLLSDLPEGPIGCHESLDHRGNELGRVGRCLPSFPADRLGVGNEIAMNRRGKFDGQFHRLVILERAELELRHRLAS